MKKTGFMITLLLAVLFSLRSSFAESALVWTPFVQQTGMYFSSERVTMGGAGIGVGAQLTWKKNWIAQTDANLVWGNGNAVSTRLALGYQREGRWQPAILSTFDLLWGQRTEVLSDSGERPAAPVWVVGLRGMPLRFTGPRGYVSALEFGYGVGPDAGYCLEFTVLTAGIRW